MNRMKKVLARIMCAIGKILDFAGREMLYFGVCTSYLGRRIKGEKNGYKNK